MNSLFLSASFASLGCLPLMMQTPAAPTRPLPVDVKTAVQLTPQTPTAPVATTAPKSGHLDEILVKLEQVAAPAQTEGVVLEVVPVVRSTNEVELVLSTSSPQEEDTEVMRKRILELEAQLEALTKKQSEKKLEGFLTRRENKGDAKAGARTIFERRVIREQDKAAGSNERFFIVDGETKNSQHVHSEGAHGHHTIEVHAEGQAHQFPGDGERYIKLQSNGSSQPFVGGRVIVESKEAHEPRIWITESEDTLFPGDKDEADCESHDPECEHRSGMVFHFPSDGSHEGFNLEELHDNLEDWAVGFEEMEINLEDMELNIEDMEMSLEDMELSFGDLDLDLEEILEAHDLDGEHIIVRLGQGQASAPQARTVTKRFFGGTKPRVIMRTSPEAAEPQRPEKSAKAPRAPAVRRAPRAPLPARVVQTPKVLAKYKTSSAPQEEWSDLLKEMQDELHELRDVVGALSRELQELSAERRQNQQRKSMR